MTLEIIIPVKRHSSGYQIVGDEEERASWGRAGTMTVEGELKGWGQWTHIVRLEGGLFDGLYFAREDDGSPLRYWDDAYDANAAAQAR